MKSNLFIRYKGVNPNNDSEIRLESLAESINGFDQVLKDLFSISKINRDISIYANKVRQGSLIIDLSICVDSIFEGSPFERVNDLLEFLKVVNKDEFYRASEFFSNLKGVHRSLNDYFARNPLDHDLITIFIAYLLGRAGAHKDKPDIDNVPKDYAIALHKMIKNGKFKKALKPFIENELASVEVSEYQDFSKIKTRIDRANFESYLSEKEKVLPEYEDGKLYIFTGTIVGMQCSRGDSMTLRVNGIQKKYRDLISLPPPDKSTKDYDKFYGKQIVARVCVERTSLYQKPKLHIQEISLQQDPLL